VIAVLRLEDAARTRPVVDALSAGGVRAVEITLTMPGALEAMRALAMNEGILVGAGSVLDEPTARLAILAGARFVVAPTFRADVVEACHRYDVVAVPGAYSPTEILTAWEAGADLVKLFPASGLGPSYVKEVKSPLPQVLLLPTGGVTAENAGAFVRAGAAAVGVGGALVDRDAVARGDYARLTEQARRLTAAIRAAREQAR
jgi:2-dehydro-3-deoxyphosphogluconate aldolase/(4S)-4-hydroxy-2-oxoglutarate aldolase